MEKYAIDIENVSLMYEEYSVLKNLSLKVRFGEHIGILGDSGCGKSTLLKMISGLYVPDEGKISVMGEVKSQNIRKQVALVMQQNSLFPLSIRDNITCGHQVQEEMLWEVCRKASLMTWIDSLPDGIETNVGVRGGQVSGGQAQRIQIARALCKNAPIVLLDEPASALDQETAQSVLNALEKVLINKTVVHITHHPETLDSSYVMYRMEGGQLQRE